MNLIALFKFVRVLIIVGVIASLALFAYINREEVGRLQADRAWQEKQQLDQALHQFASLIAIANTTTGGKIEDEYDRLLHPALTMLLDSLAQARKSDLYRALSNIETVASGKPTASELMLFFEAQIQASLHAHTRGIDVSLFAYYDYLVDALSQITKENIYDLAHGQLSGRMSEFMREAAASVKAPPDSTT